MNGFIFPSCLVLQLFQEAAGQAGVTGREDRTASVHTCVLVCHSYYLPVKILFTKISEYHGNTMVGKGTDFAWGLTWNTQMAARGTNNVGTFSWQLAQHTPESTAGPSPVLEL